MSKVFDWDTEGSGQPKISKFQNTLSIDQKILWFQVSMQNLVLVTFGSAIKQLVKERLHLVIQKWSLGFIQQFLEILIEELKY